MRRALVSMAIVGGTVLLCLATVFGILSVALALEPPPPVRLACRPYVAVPGEPCKPGQPFGVAQGVPICACADDMPEPEEKLPFDGKS